ncbi:MAG: LptF/LptG family permease [Phycisphaerales bacterium]
MNTLDRAVARQFLINILLLLVILFSFVVVVDVSLNLQRFVNQAERLAAQRGETLEGARRFLSAALLVVDLWWPRLLQLFNYLIGFVLVGAMGFTVSQMVRNRELVAMMASGVSLYRVARPLLLVGVGVLGVQVLNQELVMPQIAPLVARSNTQAGDRTLAQFPVQLAPDGSGRLWQAASFDPVAGRLSDVNIWERDSAGRAQRRISATHATFIDGRWVFVGGRVRNLRIEAGGPRDAQSVASITSDLDPTALVAQRYRTYATNLSWRQIREVLASPKVKPELAEQLTRVGWGRLSQIICTFLTLVVSIPFFLTREPLNPVIQSLKCAPVAVGSLLGATLAIMQPIPGLPVELAAFIPVLTLLPVAIAMGTSIKT